MKCGKTDLCEVQEIKGKYQVTWNKYITGLDVYSEKVYILLDMILKGCKSWDVGIVLTNGYVLWLNCTVIETLDKNTILDYLIRAGNVRDHREVLGAVFDNMDDVETFADRLEKKYIVHVLKS